MKTNKIVVDFLTIKRLITILPGITVEEAIELIRAARLVKDTLGIDVIGVADGGDY